MQAGEVTSTRFAAKRGGAIIAVLIALLLALPAAASAEVGDLDPAFGQQGYAKVPKLQYAEDIAGGADGAVFVAGTDAPRGDPLIVGLDGAGNVDESFGLDGILAPDGVAGERISELIT